MILGICNYDYYLNDIGPVLRLVCRNQKQERIFIDVQDEKFTPHFYIIEEDKELFMHSLTDAGVDKLIIKTEPGLITEYGEPTLCIYTKYPHDVRKIRNHLIGLRTFQGDVKWEKMVVQMMKWRSFIVVDDDEYSEYGFTPLSAIHNSEKRFIVDFNICYWDIETDAQGTTGRQWADCRFAHKISIITYVTFNKHKQIFTYYGWKEEWKTESFMSERETRLGEKALSMPTFKDYPHSFPFEIKKFSNEIDMHKTFLNDFSNGDYDGLMTFNGRGGNRSIRGKKQWFTGFDLPIFFERCVHLGLYDEIQKMSTVRPMYVRGRMVGPSTKRYIKKNEYDIEVGREFHIKCVPQHDLLYDDNVLFYTAQEYDMKRHNLDTYMNYILGVGKVEHKGSVAKMHRDHWKKCMEYNAVDVEGIYALDLYFGYTTDVALRALIYCGKIEDGVYASKIHDHIKLWYTNDMYLLPTRDFGRKINGRE